MTTLAERGGIAIRRLRRGDLAAFQAYRNDPDVGRYQGWEPMSDAEAAGFLTACAQDALFLPGHWTQLGIAEAATDRLIGDLGIRIEGDASAAELGISLARGAQGRGLALTAFRLMTEIVFAQTEVARIVAITDSRNAPSLALLRRAGMRHEQDMEAVFRGEACVESHFTLARPP